MSSNTVRTILLPQLWGHDRVVLMYRKLPGHPCINEDLGFQANNHSLYNSLPFSLRSHHCICCVQPFFVMADIKDRLRGLEKKIAHYEAIMGKCPRCRTALPAPEAQSTAHSQPNSRASRLAQRPAAKIPPPTLTGPSKRPAPASTLSSFARSSKQLQPVSRTEPQAEDLAQYSPSNAPPASSNRSHRTTEPTLSSPRPRSTDSSDRSTTGSVTLPTGGSSGHTAASQIPSPLPSSLALSTADGRRPHSGKLVHLDLQQQYKKPRSRTQAGRSPGESPRHADWMRVADIMLEEVPSGRNWREKVSTMDSSIIAAVAMGGVPVPEGDVSPTEDIDRIELIRVVRRFAERHSEGRVNFEHFILVCLCKVLSFQGVPQGTIVETLQICISDTSRRNITRYLKGATWANEIMSDLFFTDWGYRAVDLIAICKQFRKLCSLPADVFT